MFTNGARNSFCEVNAVSTLFRIEVFRFPGYNPAMITVIADDRCRVKLAEIASPGDRFDVSTDRQGRVILRKLEPSPRDLEKIPVAKVSNGKDGLPVVDMPGATSAKIARAVREERNRR